MSGNLRINTALDDEHELEVLLAKQAEIQAEIASLLPSTAPPSSYTEYGKIKRSIRKPTKMFRTRSQA